MGVIPDSGSGEAEGCIQVVVWIVWEIVMLHLAFYLFMADFARGCPCFFVFLGIILILFPFPLLPIGIEFYSFLKMVWRGRRKNRN